MSNSDPRPMTDQDEALPDALNPRDPTRTLCRLGVPADTDSLDTATAQRRGRFPFCLQQAAQGGITLLNSDDLLGRAPDQAEFQAAAQVTASDTVSAPAPLAQMGQPALYVLTVQRHYFDKVVLPQIFLDGPAAAAAYDAAIVTEIGSDDPEDYLLDGCSLHFHPGTQNEAHFYFGEEADSTILRVVAVSLPAGLSLAAPAAPPAVGQVL